MVPIYCKNCKKTFTRTTSFRNHLSRCKGLVYETGESGMNISDTSSETSEQEDSVTCTICNKSFHNKYNLLRHVNTVCEPNQIKQILANPTAYKLLEKAMELNASKSSSGPVQNTNCGAVLNVNGNGNNIKQETNNSNSHHYNINPIGKEDLTHITHERKLKILQKGIGAVGELFRVLMEKKANWNMVIIDKRNEKVLYVARNGDILIGDLNKVIKMATIDNIDRIDEFLDELYNELRLKDKTILRLMEAQNYTPPGQERDPDVRHIYYHEKIHGDYHERCSEQIKDHMDLLKSIHLPYLKKYMAQQEASKLN